MIVGVAVIQVNRVLKMRGGEELGDDALFCDRGKMTRHA